MKKITVAEYAKLKGISKTAVYKKLKRLNTVKEEINGKEQILIIIDDNDTEKPENNPNSTTNSTEINPNSTINSTELNPDTQPNSTTNSTPDSTKFPDSDIIEVLRKQLQEKDKQIERLQKATEEKDKQIKEQFDKFTELLYRQQQLEAITQSKLLGEGEAENKPEEEQNKKPGFFSRLFKRKKEER